MRGSQEFISTDLGLSRSDEERGLVVVWFQWYCYRWCSKAKWLVLLGRFEQVVLIPYNVMKTS